MKHYYLPSSSFGKEVGFQQGLSVPHIFQFFLSLCSSVCGIDFYATTGYPVLFDFVLHRAWHSAVTAVFLQYIITAGAILQYIILYQVMDVHMIHASFLLSHKFPAT
jgi:hypothetical protein